MKIPRLTPEDADRFRAMVPADPRVEVRPMFGNLGAYVNGNMFMGTFGPAVGVKLSGPDRAVLDRLDGAGPFGPPERPMGGYATVPPLWWARPPATSGPTAPSCTSLAFRRASGSRAAARHRPPAD
ncbi:MAG: TfoX/Sxy family protein [Chloroflexota bacterium]